MADDGFRLEIDGELGRRLKAAAEAAGQPADQLAADLIARGLDDGWREAEERLAEYDRTGESVSLDEVGRHFQKAVMARLQARRA